MLQEAVGPDLYVVAGANGAGKTTFAREFLPHFARCTEFVNADLIAGGLSPFLPGAVAIEAGRVMLKRVYDLAARRQSFGFETTLSGKRHVRLFRELRRKGYRTHLIYLWLPSAELAVQRVRDRVRLGGHPVPEEDVRRRFNRGLKNLFSKYRFLFDTWTLFDNSVGRPRIMACEAKGRIQIFDEHLFQKIKSEAEKI